MTRCCQYLALEDVVRAAKGPTDLVPVYLLEQPDLLAVREAVAAAQHGVHEGQVGAVEPRVRLRARLPRFGLVIVEMCSNQDSFTDLMISHLGIVDSKNEIIERLKERP